MVLTGKNFFHLTFISGNNLQMSSESSTFVVGKQRRRALQVLPQSSAHIQKCATPFYGAAHQDKPIIKIM